MRPQLGDIVIVYFVGVGVGERNVFMCGVDANGYLLRATKSYGNTIRGLFFGFVDYKMPYQHDWVSPTKLIRVLPFKVEAPVLLHPLLWRFSK